MVVCPNKSLPEWKSLSEKLGENNATLAFIRNGNEIPQNINKARELITNRGLLESFETLPKISEESVFGMLKNGGMTIGDEITLNGKTYYKINEDEENIGRKLGDITGTYGSILEYDGGYVSVNEDAIKNWNRISDEFSPASKSLTDLSKSFLTRIGVSLSEQNDVIEKYGSNGIADFAERIVRIQSGKMDVALPEEALHFFLDMMDQSDPALLEALDKIRNTSTYKQTLEQYKNNPNYKVGDQVNFSKIRKEALAKHLAASMIAKDQAGLAEWVKNVIQKIINYIKGVKLQKTPYEVLEQMFYEQRIEDLNLNIDSNEIYNQLTDERKEFYEAQLKNASKEQEKAVKDIIAHTATVFFHPETHTLIKTDVLSGEQHTLKNSDGTLTVVNGTKLSSVTGKLGSDFYSKLENPDAIAEIALFHDEAVNIGGVDENLEPIEKSRKIVDYLVEQLLVEDLTEETLRDIVSKEIADNLIQAKENKEKTLFGTAIHSIAENIILGKKLNLDDVDPIIYKFLSKDQLRDLIFGTAYEPGIQTILKKLIDEGHVLMTEVAVGNNQVGGIIDVIAIDRDGVSKIYDFKTKFVRKFEKGKENLEEEFTAQINTLGNLPVKSDDTVIPTLIGSTRSRKTKYAQQQSIYKTLAMQAGIKVGDINVVGIPYRIDEETKKISETGIVIVPLPYSIDFADFLFPPIDESLDASKKQDAKKVEDERLEFVKKIDAAKLKENFAEMLGKLTKLFNYYSKSKDAKEVYNALNDIANKTNRLQLQTKEVQNVLDNWEEVTDFLNVQSKFLEFIDSIGDVIKDLHTHYYQLVDTVAQTDEAKSQRLNQMAKVKDMLLGYDKMLNDILPTDLNLDSPLAKSINVLRGQISILLNNYTSNLANEISSILGSEFFEDTFEGIKREYNEMIVAARTRGDEKKAKELEEERDKYTTSDLVYETLIGNKGDVNDFYSNLMATISNPDVVVSSFARRLKATLDKVRLQNKDLRDRFGTEYDKRSGVYGRGLDVKSINESLVYVVNEYNSNTGETVPVLYFKTMFDERLYSDHSKLIHDVNKAEESGDKDLIKKAKKALREFEKKYMQTRFTEAYYRLTKALDQKVTYQNEETTVRDIRGSLYERINRIKDSYRGENIQTMEDISPEHFQELLDLEEQLSQLREKYDSTGKLKTGDALKIALALEEYESHRDKLYETIEDQTSFDLLNDKMKVIYGEDSEQYKKWYANNTRLVISDEYYKRRDELIKEKGEILEQISDSQEIKDLYRELSVLTKPYRDKDGFINGARIKPAVAQKIKEIQDKIDELGKDATFNPISGFTKAEHNKVQMLKFYIDNNYPYIDPDTGLEMNARRELRDMYRMAKERQAEQALIDPDFAKKMDRLKEINSELYQMSSYTNTKYYYDELRRQQEMFAESRGITYNELKSNREYYNEFKESEWFINNHKITKKVIFEDPETGEVKEAVSEQPNYQWRRNMPLDKYIEVRPGRHFSRTILKEFYTDENGNRVDLFREDNRDVRNRYKPKSNEEYKKEFGQDHPYLNKDYMDLKNKYDNGTASEKEKADYENLLFIENEMLQGQENLPPSQALGMAVPFLEKRGGERVIESGGKSVFDRPKSWIRGIRRALWRTEQDLDQEGIASKKSSYALATIENSEVKFVPVKYSTKGKANDASYDVWGAALNYLSSINRKKALDYELAVANGLEEVLAKEEYQPKSEKEDVTLSRIFKKYFRNPARKYINKGTNLRKEVVKSFINTVFYNEEYFEGFTVPLLGMNSHKLITQLNNLTSFDVLSVAPLNWATNFFSGNVQNIVGTAGGRFMTKEQFLTAKKIIYSDSIFGGKYGNVMKDMMTDFSKVGNLSFWGQVMEVFDPIQGEFENEFGDKTNFNAFKNVFKAGLYAGKIWGEWEIQMSAFIAFMMNHKVYVDPNTGQKKVYSRENFITLKLGGDVTSLSLKEIADKKLEAIKEFEALENDLLSILELDKNKKLSVKDEFKDAFQFGTKDFSRVVAELHGMQKRINGSYAKFDKSYAEKLSLGRLFFFFRKYLIPIGVRRLGTRRVDWETESVEQGFYITFWQTYMRDISRLRFRTLVKWSDLSDFEKRAVKATLTDAAVVIMINALLLPLLGYDDDDKDKYKKVEKLPWWRQAGIFVSKKVKSETEQFFPLTGIEELKRIYQNFSLTISQIFNLGNIAIKSFYHVKEWIYGEKYPALYYKKDSGEHPLKQKGDAKVLAMIAALFGYKGYVSNPIDAIRSFDKYNSDVDANAEEDDKK